MISAVDWFKRCHFILLDSIISAESEMSHMDGFQSREARKFTSTMCSQPKQHMPYDLPSDDFKHPKAYAVISCYVTSPRAFRVMTSRIATRNGRLI